MSPLPSLPTHQSVPDYEREHGAAFWWHADDGTARPRVFGTALSSVHDWSYRRAQTFTLNDAAGVSRTVPAHIPVIRNRTAPDGRQVAVMATTVACRWSAPILRPPFPHLMYARFFDRGAIAQAAAGSGNGIALGLGNPASTNTRSYLRIIQGTGTTARLEMLVQGSGNDARCRIADIAPGSINDSTLIEMMGCLMPDGTPRVVVALNEGAPIVGDVFSGESSIDIAAAWAGAEVPQLATVQVAGWGDGQRLLGNVQCFVILPQVSMTVPDIAVLRRYAR